MATDALEEKILKIRQQNEEIRRRHEEVEADKKNAAQLNALVQMSPSTDWPERKEPPEFSSTSAVKSQSKPRIREQNTESNNQYRPGGGVGGAGGAVSASNGTNKKIYSYPQGEGPPPDPKYNFLADSEREEQRHTDNNKNDNSKNRGKNNKIINKSNFRKKNNDKKDIHGRDYYEHCDNTLDESHPDYDAWRIERKKIDEARINRQITAEGNWRREWDNDKMYMIDDISKKENNRFNFGFDNGKQHEHNDADRFYSRGQYSKNYNHTNVNSTHRDFDYDKKVSFTDDKNNKPIVNHTDKTLKNSVTSVKMSAANVAGTGRVGPRQRTRMMYSSQSGGEYSASSGSSSSTFEISTFNRQTSLDDKPNNTTKSPHTQRKRETDKSLFSSRKDDKYDLKLQKSSYGGKKDFKSFQKPMHTMRQGNNNQNYTVKSPTSHRNNTSKFTDKKNDIKSVINTDDDNEIKEQVEIPDNNEEDEAFYNDSKEYSNDFEINYFDSNVHDDSGYVDTTCDNSVDVKMMEQLVDRQDLLNIEHEPVEENLLIAENERVIDLKNDCFVDEKAGEQINNDNLNNGSSTSDECVPNKNEIIEKDVSKVTENEDIQVENETNINVLITEKVEDVVEVKNEKEESLIVEKTLIEEEQQLESKLEIQNENVKDVKNEIEESLIVEKIIIDEEQPELKLEIQNENKTNVLTSENVVEDVKNKIEESVVEKAIVEEEQQLELKLEIQKENVNDVKNEKKELFVDEKTLVKEEQQPELKLEIQNENNTDVLMTENFEDIAAIKNKKEESIVEKIIIDEKQQPDTKLFIPEGESQDTVKVQVSPNDSSITEIIDQHLITQCVTKDESILPVEEEVNNQENLSKQKDYLEDNKSIIDNKLPESSFEELNNVEKFDVPIVTDKNQSTSTDATNNNHVKNNVEKVVDSSNNE
ncbi:hypothetical protein HCN44_005622 [Aphidius gifuensis]|uniref:Uncharacterized protein n=1 Tax=Aphidius gifuensis TaxID=684658 RepID=A0A834Y3F1_APHGI|nr:putative uncharacterized protein DDB_G0282133 [Aphidius gifuensis]KAF7997345.1 hypothetical protein HCN44_005622 [Aphidius gifuensis]